MHNKDVIGDDGVIYKVSQLIYSRSQMTWVLLVRDAPERHKEEK